MTLGFGGGFRGWGLGLDLVLLGLDLVERRSEIPLCYDYVDTRTRQNRTGLELTGLDKARLELISALGCEL